jgi:hypothetical protein
MVISAEALELFWSTKYSGPEISFNICSGLLFSVLENQLLFSHFKHLKKYNHEQTIHRAAHSSGRSRSLLFSS